MTKVCKDCHQTYREKLKECDRPVGRRLWEERVCARLLALLALAVAGAVVVLSADHAAATVRHRRFRPTARSANGKYMFTAGGCAECHAAPVKACDDLKTKDKEALAGGRCLKTPFGTFHVPNISPDKETGIGNGPRSTSSTP